MSITSIGHSIFSLPPFEGEPIFDERLICDDMYKLDHLDYLKISSKKMMRELFPTGFSKDKIHLPQAFERIKEHPAYHYWKELRHKDKTDEMLLEEFVLDGGTCYGQTLFIIDCIKAEPTISSEALVEKINWQIVFYTQMMHHIGNDLMKAREDLGVNYLDQVAQAKMDYENSAVIASKEKRDRCNDILSLIRRDRRTPSIESSAFLALESPISGYESELKRISLESPSLGTIHIKPHRSESSDFAHVIFFQAFPGIFRMYDPNYGVFEYPDLKTLMIGLKIFANHDSGSRTHVVKFQLY